MFFAFLFTGHPRRAVRQLRMRSELRHPRHPVRLHLGCGKRRLEGYINIDCNWSPATDYVGDIADLPCSPNTVERIETYHVLEHIPHPLVPGMLQKWLQVLVPGGKLVIECPNFDLAAREYLSGNDERLLNIFGRQRFPGDAHLFGYNPRRLRSMLETAGYSDIVESTPQDYHVHIEPCMRLEAAKPVVDSGPGNRRVCVSGGLQSTVSVPANQGQTTGL